MLDSSTFAIFAIISAIGSAGIVAALSRFSVTVFAENCNLGTQNTHYSGKGTLNGQAGNFKCDLSADKCSFSAARSPGQGWHCTGNLRAIECKGKLTLNDFPLNR